MSRPVQHLWFIVGAPALWLPLGLVILGSGVLPRMLGYLQAPAAGERRDDLLGGLVVT